MKIDIIWQHSDFDRAVSNQLARLIRSALGHFGTFIQTVALYITDASDRKDRVSVRCIVSMKLMSTGDIVFDGRGENVFSALNHCLSGAGSTITRLQERRRNTPNRKSSTNRKYIEIV